MVTGKFAIGLIMSVLQNWFDNAVNSSGAVSPAIRATASSTPVYSQVLQPAEAAAQDEPAAVEVPFPAETAAASVPAAPQEEPAPVAAPGASHADASAAILALCKAGKKAAAVSILATFNATKLTQVAPEDYAALIAACEAANV
jgi:hypothetical protein